jgi:hypothetical protein
VATTLTACAPSLVVHQIPGPGRTADDPALRGELPQPPLAFANPKDGSKGSFALDKFITWTPISQFDLAPSSSKTLTVHFREGVMLFGRAIWYGGSGPVRLVVSQSGASLASVKRLVAPGHGAALAQVRLPRAGSATVTLTNDGPAAVTVRAAVGTLPLSLERSRP